MLLLSMRVQPQWISEERSCLMSYQGTGNNMLAIKYFLKPEAVILGWMLVHLLLWGLAVDLP